MLSNSKQVGLKIREYREKLGMTQKELGYLIDKTWEMVSRYERGLSSAHREIDAIANALGVSTAALVDSENDKVVSMFPRVPMFTKSARSEKSFRINKTNIYYNCPDWVLKEDKDTFAVPSSIVNVVAQDIKNQKGVFFISPNTHCSMGDLTLYFEEYREARVVRLSFIPKDEQTERVMGRVLAFERHFPV